MLDDEYKVSENEILKHITSVKEKKDFKRSVLAGGLQATFKGKKLLWKRITIAILYLVAVGIMIGYGFAVSSRTDSGNLGHLTTIATVVSDIFIFLIAQINMSNGPLTTAFLVIGMRCFLFGFGGTYWFVGYCFLFLLVTLVIGWYIASLSLPLELYKPKKSKPKKKLIMRIIKHPLFTYIFANVVWAVVVAIVATVDLGVPTEAFELYGTTYEPWTWGVASYFITWIFAMLAYTYRLGQRRGKGIRDVLVFCGKKKVSTYLLMLILTYLLTILIAVFWFIISDELFILFCVLFLPLILISVYTFKVNFSKNEYRIFADIKELNAKTQKILDREEEIRGKMTNLKKSTTQRVDKEIEEV
mmetsp:Transcript_963/g.879  ORF Transcript_963/g.879 Transcript_963/m.879 type:complete len:359 (-) Transcript_963:3431-4507(-)